MAIEAGLLGMLITFIEMHNIEAIRRDTLHYFTAEWRMKSFLYDGMASAIVEHRR